ncbi:MAG: TonB family protein, partial [Acidobacteriota bacterium]
IPNYLSAVQRAKQKRTIGDMQSIARVLELEHTSAGSYPASADALKGKLPPDLVFADAWGHPLRYASLDGGRSYVLISPGKDGTFQLQDPGGYDVRETAFFDCDIVYRDGAVVQRPRGMASSLPIWAPTPTPEAVAPAPEPAPAEPLPAPEEPTTPEAIGLAEPAPPPPAPGSIDQPGTSEAPPSTSGSLKLVKKVEPVYPPLAKKARVGGNVEVEALIEADGRVSDAHVLRSDSALLEQAAIDAVRQWRFEPQEGRPVVRLTVRVAFAI